MLKIGSRLEKVFKFFKIDKFVLYLFGENCGCDKRRDALDNIDNYFKRK